MATTSIALRRFDIVSQILHAYGFDQITFAGAIVGNGAGQTIAIVDAYDTPTIEHDLAAFNAAFGLRAPPSFLRIAQDGSTNYPNVDPAGPGGNNWEVETALDVEWGHALAPMANIILVEAASNGLDLYTAVDYARNVGGRDTNPKRQRGFFVGSCVPLDLPVLEQHTGAIHWQSQWHKRWRSRMPGGSDTPRRRARNGVRLDPDAVFEPMARQVISRR
jgi:hypothetical protein